MDIRPRPPTRRPPPSPRPSRPPGRGPAAPPRPSAPPRWRFAGRWWSSRSPFAAIDPGERPVAELTTVADDEAVIHDGPEVAHATTASRPTPTTRSRASRSARCPDLGERLATVATVNDVHFGEDGVRDPRGPRRGPDLPVRARRAEPYPEVMNRGAIAEMAAIDPDARGGEGRPHLRRHRRGVRAVPRRLRARVRRPARPRPRQPRRLLRRDLRRRRRPQRVDLPGVTLAVLDTTDPGHTPGRVTASSSAWLDDLAARRPTGRCSLFGHHHVWSPDSAPAARRPTSASTPTPRSGSSAVVARHPGILGYFAGHTHRNRVRRFRSTGDRPVGRGGLREGLPGHLGRVPGVRAAACCRSTAASPRPRRWRGPSRPATCTPAPTRAYAFGAARRPLLRRCVP